MMKASLKNTIKLGCFVVFFVVSTLWGNAQSIQNTSDTLFRVDLEQLEKEAAVAIKKYRYKEALVKLGEYVAEHRRMHPQNDTVQVDSLKKVLLTIVECQKKLNLFNDAILILNELQARDTTDLKILHEIADCFFLSGEFKECAGVYTRMLQQDSTNTYFEYQRALINIKGEYWKEAFSGLVNLYRRGDSTNNVILRLMGDCFYNTGDGGRALEFYDRAIRVRPQDQFAVRKISIIYLNLMMADRALAYTNAYRALDSANVEVNQINGIARYVIRDFTGAETVLKKLIDAGDDTYNTNYYYGLTLVAQNRFNEALPPLEVAYGYDTTSVEMTYHLGNACCRALTQEERGLQLLQQGLDEMKPKKEMLFKYHVAMATGYSGLRKYDEADWHTMLALEQNPRYVDGFYYRGVYCDYQKNRKKQATEHYRDYFKYGRDKVLLANAEARFKALQEELFMEGVEIKPLEPRPVIKMAKDTVYADVKDRLEIK